MDREESPPHRMPKPKYLYTNNINGSSRVPSYYSNQNEISHRPYTAPTGRTCPRYRVPSQNTAALLDYPESYGQFSKKYYPVPRTAPTQQHIPNLTKSKTVHRREQPTNLLINQGEPRNHPSKVQPFPQNESLIEWFDRKVEAELNKCRKSSNTEDNLLNISPVHQAKSPSDNSILYEDYQLLDAVSKLAKAEALAAFEGAIKAAEEAAAKAPPELAEEAAAAGAKDFQAELTGIIKQDVPGIKPIEVIGYVGITRPKIPKKTSFVNQ